MNLQIYPDSMPCMLIHTFLPRKETLYTGLVNTGTRLAGISRDIHLYLKQGRRCLNIKNFTLVVPFCFVLSVKGKLKKILLKVV